MKQRYNAYDKSLYNLIKKVDTACPKCKKLCVVNAEDHNNIRVTCIACGYFKPYTTDFPRTYYMNTNADPYFLLPLWYQARFGNEIIWAYNKEHLEILEKHISADLRERNQSDNQNSSIGSRLPKWMTSSKNRKQILRIIEKLRGK